MVIERKWARLKSVLQEMELAVLAYSGGVDSSLLLKAASEVMGPHLIAATALSETYPAGELEAAKAFVRSLGITHRIIETSELTSEEFVKNPPDRCYHCKKELFEKLTRLAAIEGIATVIEGSNVDDLKDRRPGRRAAEEFKVRSPLIEAELSKAEIRQLARDLGLSVWDKPSLACLSSRIPFGTRITADALRTIQAAEDVIRGHGLKQVRVRHHGDTARIEVNVADFTKFHEGDAVREIVNSLKQLGYTYVCLDLEGYRTGSMNEGLDRLRSADFTMRNVKTKTKGAKA